ncbi:molecular chaperone [Morganella morganii]
MKKSYLSCTFLLVTYFFIMSLPTVALSSEGGLRLAQTRVIFNSDNNNVNVAIKNNSQKVYLIKVNIMNTPEGNDAALPSPPFMVRPPIFRLEKESQNTALIVRNGTSVLPTDRESVFWLSFLAIPSVSKNSHISENMTSAQVSVGIRTVIKLFYRPAGLPMTFTKAQEKLTFIRHKNSVTVDNPTPYYLTLATLSFDNKPVDLHDIDPMIAPFSSAIFPVEGLTSKAQWAVITDYGDMGQIFSTPVTTGK